MSVLTGDHYITIGRPGMAEFRDRGSRFIGYTFPLADIAEFKDKLAELKKEHAKATHHCFAYRLGFDGNVFRVSDDGEPSGTAGRPILGQMDARGVTNALVVVVRYFGGSLLGVPGLISAYKNAASMALQVTPLVQKPFLKMYRVEYDYTMMNDVMRVVKQFDCTIGKQETNLFCSLEIGVPLTREMEVLYKMKDLRGVNLDVIKTT